MAILGELDRAGLLHRDVATVHRRRPWARRCELGCASRRVRDRRSSTSTAPRRAACRPTRRSRRIGATPSLDLDRSQRLHPRQSHAYTQDGGLAVLYGNIAERGCIVKTAGVDESIWKFTRPARVFECQEAGGRGDPWRRDRRRRRGGHPLRGSEGRAGHAGDALPDLLPEVQGHGQGLRAAHRRPLLRRHVGPVDRPRLAGGGRRAAPSAWSRKATRIEIDIPNRRIHLAVRETNWPSAASPWRRRAAAWKPTKRERPVSAALQAYAAMTTSADTGAVRDIAQLE